MRAVTRMLDLAEIFQLVKDGFSQRPSLQQRLGKGRVLNRLHVFAHLGEKVHLAGAQQVDQPLGDVSLIPSANCSVANSGAS